MSGYKNLPTWKRGMSFAHTVYAAVEAAGAKGTEAGTRLRKAAVSVPSLVGEAFLDLPGSDVEEALGLAETKLAEVASLLTSEPVPRRDPRGRPREPPHRSLRSQGRAGPAPGRAVGRADALSGRRGSPDPWRARSAAVSSGVIRPQGGLRVVRHAVHESGRKRRVRARRGEIHRLDRVPLRVVDGAIGLELLQGGQRRNPGLDEREAVGAVPDRVKAEEASPGLAARKGRA